MQTTKRLAGGGLVLLVGLVVIGIASAVLAGDWPNWRGANHDGVSDETGLRTAWKEPLPIVWERDIGSAFSSFAIVKGRVYTCGTKDGQQVLFCLGADDGKVIWEFPIEKQYKNEHGDGARATPTINDGHVYMLGAFGRLVCLRDEALTPSPSPEGRGESALTPDPSPQGRGRQQPTVVWERQLKTPPTWGYSASVLIDGDLCIVSGGKEDGSLVALNRKTGEPVWRCGDDVAGYATPLPITFEGKRYIVGYMGNSAVIADAATGALAWQMPWKTDWEVNASAPIYHEGHLFFSSGYRHGCVLLKLRRESESETSALAADVVWQSDALRNKFQSCILHQGHLYTSDEQALKCVEFLTGNEKWSVPRIKHGTVAMADGHLFVLTEDGKLMIAPATPEKFEAQTTAEILSPRCWTAPVLYDGRIYARNMTRVVCFGLK